MTARAFGELFVDDVLFGVGLVDLARASSSSSSSLVEASIVDRCPLLRSPRHRLRPRRSGAGDLVDGHLADHGAEIGGAFEGLLFFEVVHLFDGAGVEGGVVVLFVEGLFYERAGAGDRRPAARLRSRLERSAGERGEFRSRRSAWMAVTIVCRSASRSSHMAGASYCAAATCGRLELELRVALEWSRSLRLWKLGVLGDNLFRLRAPSLPRGLVRSGGTRWERRDRRGRRQRPRWARTRRSARSCRARATTGTVDGCSLATSSLCNSRPRSAQSRRAATVAAIGASCRVSGRRWRERDSPGSVAPPSQPAGMV